MYVTRKVTFTIMHKNLRTNRLFKHVKVVCKHARTYFPY